MTHLIHGFEKKTFNDSLKQTVTYHKYRLFFPEPTNENARFTNLLIYDASSVTEKEVA